MKFNRQKAALILVSAGLLILLVAIFSSGSDRSAGLSESPVMMIALCISMAGFFLYIAGSRNKDGSENGANDRRGKQERPLFDPMTGERIDHYRKDYPKSGFPDDGQGGPAGPSRPYGSMSRSYPECPAPAGSSYGSEMRYSPPMSSAPGSERGSLLRPEAFSEAEEILNRKTENIPGHEMYTYQKDPSEEVPGFDTYGQSSRKMQERDSGKLDIRKVRFSVIVPKSIGKGEYAVIDIAMYEEAFSQIVKDIRKQAARPVNEKVGAASIRMQSDVRIRLTSPDIEIWDNEIEQRWLGEYLLYSFAVALPEDYSKDKILFNASVYENGIMRTRIFFEVKCEAAEEQMLSVQRKDIMSAFMSYASEDLMRVATIAQGIKLICPDLDLFLDVESLRSGEDWEKAIYREIEKRDMLLLCWSSHARESEWVEKEWKYALNNKGLEFIEPVPLELPDKCPPPKELSTKHFSDNLLYIIDRY